jgi:hypothetical protein
MKKVLVLLIAILAASAAWTPNASAATELEKKTAIQAGLAHLASIQSGADGSWSEGGSYKDAFTGAAVFAFLSQAANWPVPPNASFTTGTYATNVANGITLLLNDATLVSGLQTNSAPVNICPGGSGTCKGVYWYGQGEQTYSTGFVASAIAVYGKAQGVGNVAPSTGQLIGMTWAAILQDITNEFASYQSTEAYYGGGWHYYNAESDADMSTAQWGVISIGYAEAAGAATPAYVRSEMKSVWLVADQAGDGSACYQLPGGGLCDHSDTGGWLTSMAFVGNSGNSAALNAISWLNTHWKDAPSGWNGMFGPASGCATLSAWGCAPYAYPMWAVYKGLESNIGLADNSHISNKKTDCGAAAGKMPGATSPSGGVCNWWEDQNEYLVRTQNANGSWTDTEGDWPDPLNTSLFVNILGAVPLPASITTGGGTTVMIPALSLWGLLALGILLAGAAALRIRKAHAHKST